jgi:hypothetical protein
MGCSTLFGDAEAWTQAANFQKEVVAVTEKTAEAKAPEAKAPDIPPYVARCVKYGLALAKQKQAQDKAAKASTPAAKPSADQLVLAEVQTADERQKCAAAVLEYYRATQKEKAAKLKT